MSPGSFLLFAFAALAEDPVPATTVSQSDGFLRSEFLVPAPVADVRAALADPIASAKFSPDISSLTYVSRAGECPTLRAQVSGMVALSYDYKRCATKNGWHETLVSSDGLGSYEVTWQLEPVGEATRVTYAVKVDTVVHTPEFIMVRSLKTSMSTVVGRLYRFVTGKRTKD